jgi:hypothetical protein
VVPIKIWQPRFLGLFEFVGSFIERCLEHLLFLAFLTGSETITFAPLSSSRGRWVGFGLLENKIPSLTFSLI